jgi:hypothetical protein
MEDQGIMALPQAGMQAPTAQPQAAIDPKNFSPQVFDYAQMQPDQFGQDILGGMEATDPALVAQFKQALTGMQLPPEIVDALGQMVDAILAEPEKYAEIRADFIAEGVPEDILPPTFDAAYFAALNIALDQLSGQQAPVGMADGGIMSLNPVAAGMARMGRNGDRMLAHITPAEARMLRRRGGSGTINPITGQREFFLKKAAKAVGKVFKAAGDAVTGLVKGVGKVVKKIASSDIGRMALTVAAIYFMGPAGLNLAGPTGLIGVSNAAMATGINAFAGSTLVNLASGQKIGDAVKNGAVSGVLAGVGTGVIKGFDATLPGAPVTPGTGVEVTPLGEAGGTTVQTLAPVSEATISAPTLADQTANLSLNQQALYDQINAPANVAVAPGVNVASAPLSTGTLTDAASPFARSIQNLPLPDDFVQSGIPVDSPQLAFTIGNPHAVEAAYTNYIPGTPAEAALRIPPPSNVPYNLTSDYMNLVDPAQVGGGSPLPADVVYKDALAGQASTQPGFVDTIKQGYNEYIRPYTPAGMTESGNATALKAYEDTLAATKGNQKLAELAYQKALPGVFSTYGPAAAVGLGAAYLGGAFTPEEPGSPNLAPKETGTDLLRAQPGVYGTTPGGANVTYASLPTGYNYSPMQMLYRPQVTMGNPYGNIYGQRRMFAQGGIAAVAPAKFNLGGYASGGIGSMAKKYPRRTGQISGPGTGTSDDIPAMLSDGEFVMTAKAVRGAGKGSRREGAKRMYAMMRKFEGKA